MSEDLMPFDIPEDRDSIIKVLGVGGGGSNAVNHMYRQGIKDVSFAVCNTDSQALANSPVPLKIQLGASLTEGRGAGNKPDQGRQAAIENIEDVRSILTDSTKMVFITAGMGGGTGTGAAPIIAKAAKELKILTVGIVTIPFRFEGQRRIDQAVKGIKEISQYVDSLLVINNEKLREIFGDLTISNAFSRADDILTVAARGIAEIITVHGHVNVDFADVETVMQNSGVSLMGSASASGETRALEAIKAALNSPLLNNNDISGAKNILLNITSGSKEATMDELASINDYVQNEAGYTADLIWGQSFDDSLGEEISVTVIATGFETSIIPEVYMSMTTEGKEKEVVKLKDNERQSIVEQEYVLEEEEEDDDEDDFENVFELNPNFEEDFQINDLDPEPRVSMKPEPQHVQQKVLDVEQGVIAFESEDDKKDSATEPRIDERARKTVERINKLKQDQQTLTTERATPVIYTKSLDELENIPAYKRKNIPISNKNYSQSSTVSKYSITEDEEKKVHIRKGNSYLDDQVD